MPIPPIYLCAFCLLVTIIVTRQILEMRREADLKNRAGRADELERRLALIEETHKSSTTCHIPQCARENPIHAAYCKGCGASLTDASRRYHVVLIDPGNAKISTIKYVRKSLSIGLKDAKQLVDKPPQIVGMRLQQEQATKLVKKFRKVGAHVDLRLARATE